MPAIRCRGPLHLAGVSRTPASSPSAGCSRAWSGRLTQVTVIDRDKLKNVDGPFVVVANHSSHLDAPLIIGCAAPPLARYLAAGAAADYFFDVWWRAGSPPCSSTRSRSTAAASQPAQREREDAARARRAAAGVPRGHAARRTARSGHFKPGAAALVVVDRRARRADRDRRRSTRASARVASGRKPGRLPVGVVFGAPMTRRRGREPDRVHDAGRARSSPMHDRSTAARILDPRDRSDRPKHRPKETK